MTRMISAIYEDGAFRPTESIEGMPEHMPVRLTIEDGRSPMSLRDRALALQSQFTSRPYDGSEVLDQRRESDR